MSRSSQAAANPKGAHYIANLGAALVRGAWTDANPGAAPNGSPLSWNELIRKWGKHTGGSTGAIAALRNVSLLEEQGNHVSSPGSTIASSSGSTHHSRFHLRRHNAHANGSQVAPTATLKPRTADVDGEDGAGQGAWAFNSRWGRQLSPEVSKEVQENLRSLDNMLSSSSLKENERPSVQLTRAYCLFAIGDNRSALQAYETFNWSNPRGGIIDGDAAVVERIRGRTCQGILYENAPKPDPSRALQCYLAAVDLLNQLSASPLITPSYLLPPNASRAPTPSAESQREALRYVSTALTRAAVLCTHGNETTTLLRILRTYHGLSSAWPASFRPRQRQGMLNLYLSALYASYPAAGATIAEPLLTTGGAQGQTARAMWIAEVSEAFRSGRRLLSDTTHFPRAGAMNMAVIEFADQVAVFPDRTPAVTRDAINVLWWATTLTFQSQSILRHLIKLLSAAGDVVEAKRVFELYVDVVLKSRETEDPETALKLRRRADEADDEGELLGNPNDAPPTPNGNSAAQALESTEIDTDEEFVSALLIGINLLVSVLDDASEAWRYAILAGDVVKDGRVSPKTVARVWESKGIVRLAMTASGELEMGTLLTSVVDHRSKRPKYQAQAINFIRHATELDPTSATAFYHLAYAQASARAVGPAIESMQASLELDGQSVRTWHLLALLLTASGDWQGALKAAQTGVALWEEADEAITAEQMDLPANGSAPPVATGPLMTPDGHLLPPPPAQPLPESRSQRLEIIIQLRMTLTVIIEKLQGPDAALAQQQELFSFFSQRTDRGSDTMSRPRSISGTISMREAPGLSSERTTEPAPPTELQVSAPSPQHSISAGVTGASSPGDSSPSEAEPYRQAIIHKKSLLPRHLHVPSVARSHSRSASAPIRGGSGSGLDISSRSRAASTSTIALSIAPTAVHSHYHGARSAQAPPPPPIRRGPRRSPSEERLLSDLWLQSAASFRRAAKLEQSLVSIEEAETRDPENPAVWVQLGLWHLSAKDTGLSADAGADALAAFTKSLLLKPDYPAGIVQIARLHASSGTTGDLDLAHSLLTQLTQDRGWDVPQAWYSLAGVCTSQQRDERARECLLYALELEKSRPCRSIAEALPRWGS